MPTATTWRWLTAMADPDGDGDPLPRRLSAADLSRLMGLAEAHGVLAAVTANLKRTAAVTGAERIVTSAAAQDTPSQLLDEATAEASRRLLTMAAQCLLLRRQGQEVTAALTDRGIASIILKGPEFADRLYAIPAMRTFGDIDLLVGPDQAGPVAEVMDGLGYLPQQVEMKYDSGYGERGFYRPDRPGGVVEIHWNLVNSPSIRRGVSVGLADIKLAGSPARPTPAALLLIAAVHGAASHCFDRLQLLCDVCQAARGAAGPIDVGWLSEAARRTGSGLALTAALGLAVRTLHRPACQRLLDRLDLGRQRGAWRLLLTPNVVLRSHAWFDSPRRNMFRQMLKRPS